MDLDDWSGSSSEPLPVVSSNSSVVADEIFNGDDTAEEADVDGDDRDEEDLDGDDEDEEMDAGGEGSDSTSGLEQITEDVESEPGVRVGRRIFDDSSSEEESEEPSRPTSNNSPIAGEHTQPYKPSQNANSSTLLLRPATTPTPPPIPPPAATPTAYSPPPPPTSTKRRALRLPPELLSHVLKFAYMNSRRQFVNHALVARHWAESALPILWERIAPRRAVHIQLHLRNSQSFMDTTNGKKIMEEFMRVVELIPPTLKTLPKLRDLGLTYRIEEVTASLQASATTFLERFIIAAPRPERALWLKLAGIAVLDAQCKSLADKFSTVVTDFHLTKCVGITESGLRYFLERCNGVGSLALYVPDLRGSVLDAIALRCESLMDLWLDLPMEEGNGGNGLGLLGAGGLAGGIGEAGVGTFTEDLKRLLKRNRKLRRLRLRGVPLGSEGADEMLRVIGEEGRGITSLSVLVWPPESMGAGISNVSFSGLTKLIVSSNSRLSTDFLMAVSRNCPVLTTVDAGRTRIDDACVESFLKNCPVEVLDLSRCVNISGRSVTAVADWGYRLRVVDFSYCGKVVGVGMDLRGLVWCCVKRGVEGGVEKFGCDFWPGDEGGVGGDPNAGNAVGAGGGGFQGNPNAVPGPGIPPNAPLPTYVQRFGTAEA
ncbi:hypothetical protein HK097_000278, partial [Rhizophlyctis rosea]